MYKIKHEPTGLFVNLAFGGYDALNLGVNPKVYPTESLAKVDLHKIPACLEVDIQRAENGLRAFTERHLIPLQEKNAIKVNATRTKNIQFYESKIASIRKELERFERIKQGTFLIVEA